jgi:hypothetical protein
MLKIFNIVYINFQQSIVCIIKNKIKKNKKITKMTDFNKNIQCVSALNIRRIANEIINLAENQCEECFDEIIGKKQSANEHSCGMIFNVILNLDEALEKLGMGDLIDTDEYVSIYFAVEDQLLKFKLKKK